MPVLPIPMFVALVLAMLLLQRTLRGDTHVTLLALIGSCALQSAIVALVQYYGITALHPMQPLLAMVIPPVAWLAYRRGAGPGETASSPGLHLIGPALALLCLAINPMLLDVLIPLSFIAYGAAMLIRLAGGEDSLPHSRLESGDGSVIVWRIVGLSLVASAACDALISAGLASGYSGFLLWLPSIVSSLSLLALGALSLTSAVESPQDADEEKSEQSSLDLERDQAIIAKLDDYIAAHKPYLDADLTLSRLARKLTLPAKQVSAAINRVKNENVSRYINRLRIEEACRHLADGQSVTSAMLSSGFNTKSNFNREFQRVKGKSPTQWLG